MTTSTTAFFAAAVSFSSFTPGTRSTRTWSTAVPLALGTGFFHVNPAPGRREVWLQDPDGYVVVIASPDGEAR